MPLLPGTRILHQFQVQFVQTTHDAVETERPGLCGKDVILVWIAKSAKEILEKTGRQDAQEIRIGGVEPKRMDSAGRRVNKVTGQKRQLLPIRPHSHIAVKAEKRFRMLLVKMVGDSLALRPLRGKRDELSVSVALMRKKSEEFTAGYEPFALSRLQRKW